jgi:hypothetical protein
VAGVSARSPTPFGLRKLLRPGRSNFAEREHRAHFERTILIPKIRGSPIPSQGLVRIVGYSTAERVECGQTVRGTGATSVGAASIELGGSCRVLRLPVTVACQLSKAEECTCFAAPRGVFKSAARL